MHFISLHHIKHIFFFVVLAGFVSACQQPPSEHHDDFLVFGTVINITLYDVDKQTADESFRFIQEDLQIMHKAWHPWEPGALGRVNTLLAQAGEFSAGPSVIDLIHIANELEIKSQHLFNPAIGKLVALWGFHSHKHPEKLPSAQAIKDLVKQNPTLENITIKGVRVRNTNPAVKIDFGGIAKGYAIDRLLTYLKQQGIHNALINTGGDLKVIGKHGKRPWKIAIRDPRNDSSKQNAVVATINLNDNEAAFTSGDYERYFKSKQNNDKHFHHIIDPRTGYPAKGTQSVTVLHQNAATADAAATALFIAGPKQWVEIAKSMDIKYVLLIDENGKIHISSAMQKRIELIQDREIVESIEL